MTQDHPIDLSVIMAVRNEENFIEQSLTDLLNQDIDYSRVEILVADGCSDDATTSIIANVCARYPRVEVKVFRSSLRLQYAAANRLLQLSRGRHILLADGHTRFPRDFLAANLRAAGETRAGIVGGQLETRAGREGAMARAIASCLSTSFGVGNSRFRVGGYDGEVDAAPFPCIDRTVFAQVGLFREEMLANADTEFFSRSRRAGVSIRMDSRIRSVYFAREDIQGVARQMYRNAIWHTYQMSSISPRHAVPLLFTAANAGMLLGGVFVPQLWTAWAMMALFYLTAASVAAIAASPPGVDLRLRDRLLMPIAYLVIHSAAGIGWLHGLLARDTRRARQRRQAAAPRLTDPLSSPLEPLSLDVDREWRQPVVFCRHSSLLQN